LSPFHFHRLFAKWAGVTPKDFLQCLTLAHAKALLRGGRPILEAALEAGLSGPGRLHDLCVTLEAASPGEVRSGGAGWLILYGVAESPFGKCLIAESPRGICHLSFIEDEKTALADLKKDWPAAKWQRDVLKVRRLAAEIFARPEEVRSKTALRALVRGTAFQVKVWRALLAVPPGALTSYGRLAEVIEKRAATGRNNSPAGCRRSRSARAVGTAVGRNPLAYLIPCHRVIRETGVLGGYHWGLERKRAMIAWESSNSQRQPLLKSKKNKKKQI
jgi:AraC family transcriptional regulator of adaptative response/methylated-DNA-[protein]-cysteine methyltransferase